MKAVILAGGIGSRFAEETMSRPKPMIEIGDKPMLWHIMNIYAVHNVKAFVIACGYKGEYIRSYFANLHLHTSDLIVDLAVNETGVVSSSIPDWRIWMIDTGLTTMTGGRLLRLKDLLGAERFMLTYGDGVADIDITELLGFHERHGRIATVTAVEPPGRFGRMIMEEDQVIRFSEKENIAGEWINGGFFVFEPQIFDYLDGDETILERSPMERLSGDGQLMAFRHHGFWSHMDTIHERNTLEDLWRSGDAPWKSWE